jgi:hypothetical protein
LPSIAPSLAALAAILLCLPCINYPYLHDDFLQRAQRFRPSYLLPDPSLVFFRPISREIYFGLLYSLSPERGLLGHLLNAVLLSTAIVLTFKLATRVAGQRTGVIAGLLVALFGQWPVLVGWVSGAQDLLAIVFTLAAVLLALNGRVKISFVCMGAALLSKETSVAAIPALVATQMFRPRRERRVVEMSVVLALMVGVWAVVHPGVRVLLEGGANPSGDYIGLHNPERWRSLARSVIALANLPQRAATWPSSLNWVVVLSVFPLIGVLMVLDRTPHLPDERVGGTTSFRKIVWFGTLLSVPPLILTCVLVRAWSPYYVCFAEAGVATMAAFWLSTQNRRVVLGVVAAYLMLGVWSRGVEPKLETNERALAPAARALPEVEGNFKRLEQALPARSMVYVTTMARGMQSVYRHLHRFQALRVWYNEPEIQTLRPELYVLGGGPEFLFVVAPDLNVAEINPSTLEVRSARGQVEQAYVRSALRSYAIGLSGVGETPKAVELLLSLDRQNDHMAIVNRRIAAMLLLSRGDVPAAAGLLQGVPDLPVVDAIQNVGVLLTVPTRGVALEEHAMKAFGLSPDDPIVLRALLGGLMTLGNYEPAERIAMRLLAVKPGEIQALEALKRIRDSAIERDHATQKAETLGGSDR